MKSRATPPGAAATRLRVLQVAAECFPLVKTGGLADVVGALPGALGALGHDVRLLLPGYPDVLGALRGRSVVAEWSPAFGLARAVLRRGRLPALGNVEAYVVDAPAFYDRPGGGPYLDAQRRPWLDNLARFALLGWAAASLAAHRVDARWAPQVVHTHDWHAALAHAYLRPWRPAGVGTVFTVHNLAFLGLFPLADAALAALPSSLVTPDGLEFHGQLSCLKAGLAWADRVTTVSRRYAAEIATPAHGGGLDGVIRARGDAVRGIVNGIDEAVWNPATDGALAMRYDADTLDVRRDNRRALQSTFALTHDDDALLVGIVSRLSEQKGMDLVLAALPALVAEGVQFVVVGSGDAALEAAWRDAAAAFAGRVGVRFGVDEALAHGVLGGADAIAVPSRFEPCGLTQLYGLRYGTLPIVRRTGGLADTVDAEVGFVFDDADAPAFADAVRRAAALRARVPATWRAMQRAAMARPVGWAGPARELDAVYREALAAAAAA